MIQQNIKIQIDKHQLAWILTELLDEKEITSLKTRCGIRDAPAQMDSRSVNWVIENLAEAFFCQETAQQVVHEYLVQKTEGAIRRIGYMDLQEIQTFLRTCTLLVEGGDFTEIVWALLTDSRQDVQRHGQKLLKEYEHSVHEIVNVGSLTRSEPDAKTNDTNRGAHPPKTRVHENINAVQALDVSVDVPPEKIVQALIPKEDPNLETNRKLVRLQQTVNQLNDEYAALKKDNEDLRRQLQQSLQENEDFREKEHRFMEQDIHVQQLQLEIHNLTRQVEKCRVGLRKFNPFRRLRKRSLLLN